MGMFSLYRSTLKNVFKIFLLRIKCRLTEKTYKNNTESSHILYPAFSHVYMYSAEQ